jgi:hypothetical protein
MCKIMIEAGCDLTLQDTLHKTAHHYAKRNGKTEVADYLFNEYQTLKEQRKIQTDSRQESNVEERTTKKSKAKREGSGQPSKSQYRLYRSDAFGNANEVSTAEFEDLIANYPDLEEMLRNPEGIDVSGIEEIKQKDSWVKTAQKVLAVCWKTKGGHFFHEPVDPSKYNIDDYF